MKVVCYNDECLYLTQGKVYEVVEESPDFYKVVDDQGKPDDFFKWRFTALVESSELFPIY
jgi:hypothetical protein